MSSTSTLNTVDELGKGHVKTTEDKKEFTILIVGETGVGKTCFLSLIGNILAGNKPTAYKEFNDPKNEAGGDTSGSQTNEALLYTFKSNNDDDHPQITFKALDTPGLADTRGMGHDDSHRASIAHAIEQSITVVDAVLILANGTLPRLSVATDYALSTLSSMFPASLAANISFVFTNVSSLLNWNFDNKSLPEKVRENNKYLIDNPLALNDKYIALVKEGKTPQKKLDAMVGQIQQKHTEALELFVEVFDWLDTVTPHPTSKIIKLYEKSEVIERKLLDALISLESTTNKKRDLEDAKIKAGGARLTAKQYEDFMITVNKEVIKLVHASKHCQVCDKCKRNCYEDLGCAPVIYGGVADLMYRFCENMDYKECTKCQHSNQNHYHSYSRWESVSVEQRVPDETLKKTHDDAEEESKLQEKRMNDLNKELERMDTDLQDTMVEIGDLVRDYAGLSLSGTFAGRVKKSIALLELRLETIQKNKTVDDTTKLVKSLKELRKKLDIIEGRVPKEED